MNPAENIERLMKNFLQVKKSSAMTTAWLDKKILGDALADLHTSPRPQTNIWRTIIKSRITKLAAAAVIITAAGLLITLNGKFASAAYAIEQTIEALRPLRFIHVQKPSLRSSEQQDIWLEFDPNSNVIALRLEEGKDETFRIMTWLGGIIKWYSPPKQEFIIIDKPGAVREIERLREFFDPRYAVQTIYDLHLEGKVEIEQTRTPEGLIQLTATNKKPPPGGYGQQSVLLIDPQTKLADQRDEYILKDGHYQLKSRQFYLEYNQPIDRQMFVLEPPKEAYLEDRSAGAGMPQGNMTDAQAAAELVRQYIEALIAKDYVKAGKFYNGKPPNELRENIECLKIKYLRIIAIGEPVSEPRRGPRNFSVPFAFLIETSDGKKEIAGPWGGLEWSSEAEANLDLKTHRRAFVRPMTGRPDHWVIDGGI